ncbi:hypothetical protein TTHERM_00675670 (macronuclear) [Tetrahymena thermophila SB210]|uniref:Uncharacterized protein n=1 Tax=Tetrahymena thermophila (strain SB210) TaxID=312017 RepID=Q23DZ3_TETTS|nr:hypothetical protein TTHERM_00675670 [Tetrahymena thermophila SB210]EAR94794.2 hypothetical protein TTHERM_00675670 [Tetrahymena thermophila SB210]|eukprot:XP_001015039.2 hypothetical protein TTHERM_00675670 [Tetrahymena thermophila SB210]
MINFAEELEKQIKASEDQGANQTVVKEYKLAEGIYFTDFRQPKAQAQAQSSCFEIQENQKKNYVPPKEPIILEADFKEFQKRIDKMKESIEEIKQIDDWQSDRDFRDAVEENYAAISSNYNKQLAILQKFKEIDPCCDVLKKNAQQDIEEALKENKLQETAFLQEIYGLKSKNSQDMEIEQLNNKQNEAKTSQKEDPQKQQKEKQENQEEGDDDILSIQDQLNKQKLDSTKEKKDKDEEDEGVFL